MTSASEKHERASELCKEYERVETVYMQPCLYLIIKYYSDYTLVYFLPTSENEIIIIALKTESTADAFVTKNQSLRLLLQTLIVIGF